MFEIPLYTIIIILVILDIIGYKNYIQMKKDYLISKDYFFGDSEAKNKRAWIRLQKIRLIGITIGIISLFVLSIMGKG